MISLLIRWLLFTGPGMLGLILWIHFLFRCENGTLRLCLKSAKNDRAWIIRITRKSDDRTHECFTSHDAYIGTLGQITATPSADSIPICLWICSKTQAELFEVMDTIPALCTLLTEYPDWQEMIKPIQVEYFQCLTSIGLRKIWRVPKRHRTSDTFIALACGKGYKVLITHDGFCYLCKLDFFAQMELLASGDNQADVINRTREGNFDDYSNINFFFAEWKLKDRSLEENKTAYESQWKSIRNVIFKHAFEQAVLRLVTNRRTTPLPRDELARLLR